MHLHLFLILLTLKVLKAEDEDDYEIDNIEVDYDEPVDNMIGLQGGPLGSLPVDSDLTVMDEIMKNAQAIVSYCNKYLRCKPKCTANKLNDPDETDKIVTEGKNVTVKDQVPGEDIDLFGTIGQNKDKSLVKRKVKNKSLNVTKYKSCLELKKAGFNSSGVYDIYVKPSRNEMKMAVNCDMKTDGGGWIIFQRRDEYKEPHINYTRNWHDYAFGFGALETDFWLGNKNIYILSNFAPVTLRVDLWDFEGHRRFAVYDSFRITDALEGYKLQVGNYSGSAGDSLSYSNNSCFAAYDRNDERHCAEYLGGGWWYKNCTKASLNGHYLEMTNNREVNGMFWYTWRGFYYSLRRTEMKIRERQNETAIEIET